MGGYRDTDRISGSYSEDQAAYKALQQLEPNLARQTLSLIPNEGAPTGLGSLASERLMATIFSAPQKKVQDDYADAILKYKDSVEVEYTANYVSSEVQVQVIRDAAGVSLVHYTVEPARITAEEAGGKYEIRFRLTGRVSDAAGKTVYQFDKDLPFSLTSGELEDMRAKSLSIQDVFPLVPGAYNLDILLKNVLSKEFSGAARALVVPGPGEAVAMSPLLLAYGLEKKAPAPGERVPFKAGNAQLLCQARKTFSANDPLVLFFQLYGLSEELKGAGSLRYDFLREEKPFLTRTARLEPGPAGDTVIDVQSLKDFPPGYYQARVTLLDGQGKEAASAKENFEVSPAAAVPRPMVVSKVTTALAKEDDLFASGVQAQNLGDAETARGRLAEAHALAPRRADIALAYGQVLFRLNDFRRVKDSPSALGGRGGRGPRGHRPSRPGLPRPGGIPGGLDPLCGLSRPVRGEHRHPELPGDLPLPARENGRSAQSLDEIARAQPEPGEAKGARRLDQEEIAPRAGYDTAAASNSSMRTSA